MAGFDISVLRLEKKKAKSKNECPPDIGSVCLHCRLEPFGVFPVDGGAAAGRGGQDLCPVLRAGEPAARESFAVFNVLKWFICKTHTAVSASVLQPCPCALRRSAHSPPGHIAPVAPVAVTSALSLPLPLPGTQGRVFLSQQQGTIAVVQIGS